MMRGVGYLGMALSLLGLSTFSAASSYTGHMAQITQIGNRTYVFFVDGKFEGPPSPCPYTKNGMIFSIDNTKPEGLALIENILAHGRELGMAIGDGICTPNTMYHDAQGEGLILDLPR